jgi:hypothetical protein
MDEERSARMVDLSPSADVDKLQRFADVEHASNVHVQTEAAEQPAEHEEISQEMGDGSYPSLSFPPTALVVRLA